MSSGNISIISSFTHSSYKLRRQLYPGEKSKRRKKEKGKNDLGLMKNAEGATWITGHDGYGTKKKRREKA
jgi:hypothetical protein